MRFIRFVAPTLRGGNWKIHRRSGPSVLQHKNSKNSILPSFSAQYTRKTQHGFTVRVTLHVDTARNGETKKTQKRRKWEVGLQCTMSAGTTKNRDVAGTSQTLLLASTAPHLSNPHFLMQIFHRNNFRLLESCGLQTLFCRNISSIQE